jgi:LPS export ABC transporter protein LptC
MNRKFVSVVAVLHSLSSRSLPNFAAPNFAAYAVCSVLAVISVSLLCAGCERESSAGTIALDTVNLATHRSHSPTVYFMDSSVVKAVLRAAWAEVFDAKQETYLGGGVRVEFFSRATGERISILTADSAVIDDKTKDMTARGNVVVVSESPARTVRTTLMMWDNTRQRLRSSEFVSITSPEEILQGIGFESDQHLEHYTIYNVSGQTIFTSLDDEIASTSATTEIQSITTATAPVIATSLPTGVPAARQVQSSTRATVAPIGRSVSR